MALKLPPVPPHLREADYPLFRYLQELFNLFAVDGGVGGGNIDMAHSQLTGVEGAGGGSGTKHISDAEYAALQSGVSSVASGLETAQTTLDGLAAGVSTTGTDVATLQGQVSALQGQVSTLQGQVVTINATLADHEARLVAGGL